MEVTEAPRTKPNEGQKVKSSGSLPESCAVQGSDTCAPGASETACLMDSLSDVFCYVPGIGYHSLHELMSVLRVTGIRRYGKA